MIIVNNRILFIMHIPPPVHGASMVGKYIMDSVLVNKSFDATYINLSTSGSISEIGKGGLKKIINLIKIQGKVIKALRSQKYALCYITITARGAGFYKDLMIVAILKLFRKKIIYHFHNKGVSENSGKFIDNLLYRFAFSNTSSILLSPGLYPDFKKYLKPIHTYYCANGVPMVKSLSSPDPPAEKENLPCKLLFLSNMIIEKGILVLLEACRKLKEKGNHFECHFVGAWSNISAGYFENLVNNYNLAENVFAHGPKFGNEKINYFLNADIFVLPTYYYNECFPLVLLEAMSFGLPVVSTSEGGIPDIVMDNETGFIVPQKEAVILAEKLEILIQSPALRQKFGSGGKKRFYDRFTLEKFENNFVTILQSCVN